MARGGYQPPKKPAAVSGPGKLSRRTDGVQAIKSENVSDRADMQQGDRKAIEQAQAIAPLGKSNVGRTPGKTPSPTSAGAASAQPPSFLFDEPSIRPNEPTTTGMDMGPGAGSDILANPPPNNDPRMDVLQYLVLNYGNQDAAQMLAELKDAPGPEAVA